MTFKVKVANNCEEAYWNAMKEITVSHMDSGFWREYERVHNLVMCKNGYMIFKSEAHYTWFLLRYS